MNSKRVLFKWIAVVIAIIVFLQFALISPLASAQGETPTDGTPRPTLIPNTPTPTAEDLPSPFGDQSAGESI